MENPSIPINRLPSMSYVNESTPCFKADNSPSELRTLPCRRRTSTFPICSLFSKKSRALNWGTLSFVHLQTWLPTSPRVRKKPRATATSGNKPISQTPLRSKPCTTASTPRMYPSSTCFGATSPCSAFSVLKYAKVSYTYVIMCKVGGTCVK